MGNCTEEQCKHENSRMELKFPGALTDFPASAELKI